MPTATSSIIKHVLAIADKEAWRDGEDTCEMKIRLEKKTLYTLNIYKFLNDK